MPLQKGSSEKVIGNNIRELHTGKTYAHTSSKFGKKDADRQAIAIAESQARGRAMGGVAPGMPGMSQMMNPSGIASQAFNPAGAPAPAQGVAAPPMMQPQGGMVAGMPGVRGLATGGTAIKKFTGPIVSAVPGRTDKHLTHVPSGSFVIPADIVSAHGEGNTLAGMNTLQKMFKMGPHANPSSIPGSSSSAKKLAKGGGASAHIGKPVPVKLAGGEIVVPPENAHATMERVTKKKLTLDEAHAAMDKWVLNERKKLRKTLAKLPGPAKD
jgi:hypothetical protein